MTRGALLPIAVAASFAACQYDCAGSGARATAPDAEAHGESVAASVGADAAPAPRATYISASSRNTCAIRGGKVLCWGVGFSGHGWHKTLRPVEIGTYAHATAVAVGGESGCAIEDGVASCWGSNGSGQLGDGTTLERAAPAPVIGIGSPVTAIASNGSGACALVGGRAWCWGYGNGTRALVPKLKGEVRALAIANAVCAVMAAGDVRCWGSPQLYHVGGPGSTMVADATEGLSETPKPLADFADAGPRGRLTTIAGGPGPGGRFAFVFDGKLEMWHPLRFRDEAPALERVTAVSIGEKEACAILAGGRVTCWNADDVKQTNDIRLPGPATMIASGADHHCALVDGEVYCWGTRAYPALGDGARLCVPEYCWESTLKYDGGRKCDELEEPCRQIEPAPVRWP
jgi:hypothetical protein